MSNENGWHKIKSFLTSTDSQCYNYLFVATLNYVSAVDNGTKVKRYKK